jgi:hypothetical protein
MIFNISKSQKNLRQHYINEDTGRYSKFFRKTNYTLSSVGIKSMLSLAFNAAAIRARVWNYYFSFHKNYLIFKIYLAVVMNSFAAFNTASAPSFVKFP